MAVALTELAEGKKPSFYDGFYERSLEDSGWETRASILTRLGNVLPTIKQGGTILDVGSGKQLLEVEAVAQFGLPPFVLDSSGNVVFGYHFLTIDNASITPSELSASRFSHVRHLQASGENMNEIPDESADAFVSNLSMEFMTEQAAGEAFRVLKPGAPAIINLSHYRTIIPPDLDAQIAAFNRKLFPTNKWDRKKPQKPEDWEILKLLEEKRRLRDREDGMLYENVDQVWNAFTAKGFEVLRMEDKTFQHPRNLSTRIWEVDIRRPVEPKVIFVA